MNIYNVIKLIEENPKTSEKSAILVENKTDPSLKQFFQMCLDPKLLYGYNKIKEDKDRLMDLVGTMEPESFVVIMSELKRVICSRKLTGNKAIQFIEELFCWCRSKEQAELLYRIIMKDPNCGVGDKTVLSVWPDLFYIPPYQKYYAFDHDSDSKILKFPALVQTKEDGGFFYFICNHGHVELMSRTGNIAHVPASIPAIKALSELSQGTSFVLEGEALLKDKTGNIITKRQTINGVFNSFIQGTADVDEINAEYDILFSFWNMLEAKELAKKHGGNTMYIERYRNLVKLLKHEDPKVLRVVTTTQVESFDEATSFAFKIIANGGEGAMLKNLSQKWSDGTTRDGWKLKGEYECDLKCVETRPHKKNDSLIGSIRAISKCCKLETWVGSGFTDEDRNKDPEDYLGQIIEVKFTDISSNKARTGTNSFSFARFNCIRHDKKEADTLDEIKFNMDRTIQNHIV